MTKEELEILLEWRVKRGYKGLSIRFDNKAWIVNYGSNSSRTSKHFPFNPKFDLHVLYQLDEACEFLEKKSQKNHKNFKMFGDSRVSRLRHEMASGNDMEGVFLEKHSNELLRLQIQTHMPLIRCKFTIPKKLHTNEQAIGWCLAFGRQIRALSFDKENDDLTHVAIKSAWKEFLSIIKGSVTSGEMHDGY